MRGCFLNKRAGRALATQHGFPLFNNYFFDTTRIVISQLLLKYLSVLTCNAKIAKIGTIGLVFSLGSNQQYRRIQREQRIPSLCMSFQSNTPHICNTRILSLNLVRLFSVSIIVFFVIPTDLFQRCDFYIFQLLFIGSPLRMVVLYLLFTFDLSIHL